MISSQKSCDTGWQSIALLMAAISCFIPAGCRSTEVSEFVQKPAVKSRFAPSGDAIIRSEVGLLVRCSTEHGQVQLSQQLASTVATEIELASPGVRVYPWAPAIGTESVFSIHDSINPDMSVPFEDSPPGESDNSGDTDSSDVINVSFQPPSEVLPPNGPMPELAPLPRHFDQGLKIHVMELRPWFPMKAVLQLTIFNCETMDPLYSTTAEWTVQDGNVCGGCPVPEKVKRRERRKKHCEEVTDCAPSAAYDSPTAFVQIISREIAAWYAVNSGVQSMTIL